jgi:hypothetical protein
MSNFFPGNPGPTFYQKSQSNSDCCCGNCTESCYCYEVEGNRADYVEYVDCNGNPAQYLFDAFSVQRFCVKVEFTNVVNGSNIPMSITNLGLCSTIDCVSPAFCGCYTITTLIDSIVTYQDCSSNLIVSTSIAAGQHNICSLNIPSTTDPGETVNLNGPCNSSSVCNS